MYIKWILNYKSTKYRHNEEKAKKTYPIKSNVCRVKGSKLFLIDILVTFPQSPILFL